MATLAQFFIFHSLFFISFGRAASGRIRAPRVGLSAPSRAARFALARGSATIPLAAKPSNFCSESVKFWLFIVLLLLVGVLPLLVRVLLLLVGVLPLLVRVLPLLVRVLPLLVEVLPLLVRVLLLLVGVLPLLVGVLLLLVTILPTILRK